MKIAIIGAGISGLTVGQLLKDRHEVVLFEKENTPGGLVRCQNVNGNLFHICGGHVFNSKKSHVLDWFWNFFSREEEFTKADRKSVVFFKNNLTIPYPVENHAYLFDENIQRSFIQDLLKLPEQQRINNPQNFEEFLKNRFGETLYQLYFKPYNEKVWKRDLTNVSLDWLEGKLPMPTVEEMILNNFNHIEEKQFVHSSFWYEKNGGSQFLADRLSQGLSIHYNATVEKICYTENGWSVLGEKFDKIVFCGNVKHLPSLLNNIDIERYQSSIINLESHGTTSVFCEIDYNPYSWIYLPSEQYLSHRIICTGNFSPNNNAAGKMTASVEFTDEISKSDIIENLSKMPFHPKYITHHFSKYSYPIQTKDTRKMIASLKNDLSHYGLYLTGRFADWEYYNMDVAMEAAMNMVEKYKL